MTIKAHRMKTHLKSVAIFNPGRYRNLFMLILAGLFGIFPINAQDKMKDVGQFYPLVQNYSNDQPVRFSYLAENWPDMVKWRSQGLTKMKELLAYIPDQVPLKPEITETFKKGTYTRYKVRYAVTSDWTTEAYLLIPDGLTKPAPAVIALHDHGGFYYFGKEKIVETEDSPKILKDFINDAYGGRTYADELARRGFIVLCPDAFYFGSQRLQADLVPEVFRENFPGLNSSDENIAIRAFNNFCSRHEEIMAKYIFASGTTWTGILTHGDRIAVDYLLTRPEVDPGRIGCMGLSIGGFRSAFLFGLDPRIKAGVVAGWFPSFPRQMSNYFRWHTWMVYVPRMLEFFDLPDVASLNAPRPLMIMNCSQDLLYTMESMEAAAKKMSDIYNKMNASGHFKTNWYDVPHSLTIEMQDDAIQWLEQWLK